MDWEPSGDWEADDQAWRNMGYADEEYRWKPPKMKIDRSFLTENIELFERNLEAYLPKPDPMERYFRADGFTQEQIDLHCGCLVMDGHPDEECRLHGRFPWSGDWIGAKRVIISEYVPAGAIIATPTEIFVTQESWDTIYRWMKIKVDAARAVRRIVERVMADELAWLRKAGRDV